MRWITHVLARLAITATCTNSAAALDAHIERADHPSFTNSSREYLMSSELATMLVRPDVVSRHAVGVDRVQDDLGRPLQLTLAEMNSSPTAAETHQPTVTQCASWLEGFVLFGAMTHMPAVYFAEGLPTDARIARPEETSARDHRASISIVPDRPARTTWLTRLWGAIANRWADWQREREIRRAVTALAEYDDRTLRDMGIPHRSQIERVVRYCQDC